MRKIEKEIVVLSLIHEMFISNSKIKDIFRPSGITITMRGLIVFLELKGYRNQAHALKETFTGYLGDEALELIVIDFSREIANEYTYQVVTNVLFAAVKEVSPSYIPNFIRSFPHRRNELERAIRTEFVERFVAITGCNKTTARYIRIDISRKIYNVSWDTVRDKQAFTDAIIKYKMETDDRDYNLTYKPFTINIPELNLPLRVNVV